MLNVKRHFRLYRKAFADVVDARRSLLQAATRKQRRVSAAANRQVDHEYDRAYRRLLTKLRTINRRASRGLLATVAVAAVAGSLFLLLLLSLTLAFADTLLHRLNNDDDQEEEDHLMLLDTTADDDDEDLEMSKQPTTRTRRRTTKKPLPNDETKTTQ